MPAKALLKRRRFWRSVRIVSLSAAMLTLVGCGVGSSRATTPTSSASGAARLADGRLVNVVCSGHGTPTVLLESGFAADSGAWYKVQPTLARTTRVCSYDRAGSGFSDPGPLPRDGAAIARDLDQALRAAKIQGPFIVTGHSAGGLYARLFAARRPQDVRGLVLLDPTVERRTPQPANDGLDGIRRQVKRCLSTSQITPQPPVEDAAWSGCVSPKADEQALRVGRRPATWLSQLSELDNIFGRTSEEVGRIGDLLGDIPIYVVTASETAASSPPLPLGPSISTWEAQHQELASRSRAGFQTTVISTHMVMIERPDVVISAVNAMILAVRSAHRPPPLPPSETTAPTAPEPSIFNVPNPFEGPFAPEGFRRLK